MKILVINPGSTSTKLAGEKGTSFLVDENLKFKICPNEERRRNAETIYARHKIEIGHGNEIPIWLFGFLY